jgi:hypothetical protein
MGCGGHIHGGGLSGGAPGPRSRAPSMPAVRGPAAAPPLVVTAANRPLLGGGGHSGRKRHTE